jgi:hypothetical protein
MKSGFVVTFKPPDVVAGFAPAELELDEEPLDEPHPASAATPRQTPSVARRRVICAPTLA